MKLKSDIRLILIIVGIVIFKAYSAMALNVQSDSAKNASGLINDA